MTDVIIQVVNYNTKKYLDRCLESLLEDLKNASFSFRISLLDNDSNDDLKDLVEKYKNLAAISYYKNNKNVGFGAGHNILAKKNNGKYILVLNPDTEFIEEKTIERLYNHFLKNLKTKVVGPALITSEGEIQHWDHGELKGPFVKLYAPWRKQTKLTKVAWVSGAVFFVEKEFFEKVGGFDENFFLYMEEVDLCLRIRQAGKEILYDPNIKVFHQGSVVAKKDKYLPVSIKYYLEKHFGKSGKLIYRVYWWYEFSVNKFYSN